MVGSAAQRDFTQHWLKDDVHEVAVVDVQARVCSNLELELWSLRVLTSTVGELPPATTPAPMRLASSPCYHRRFGGTTDSID